jgi:hypothetical protein
LTAILCCRAVSPSIVILAKAGISLNGNNIGRNGLLLSQE